jgi:hypothetical protein
MADDSMHLGTEDDRDGNIDGLIAPRRNPFGDERGFVLVLAARNNMQELVLVAQRPKKIRRQNQVVTGS